MPTHRSIVSRVVRCTWRTAYALGLLATAGCSSADPVITGYLVDEGEAIDDVLPSTEAPVAEPESEAAGGMLVPESLGSLERPALSDQPGLLLGLHGEEALVDPITMCEERPDPCGGSLEGTWVVSATCSAETVVRTTLDSWGASLMNLTADVCSGSVNLLTMRWSGELEFGSVWADDTRRREAIAEVEIGAECLTATLQGNRTIQPSDSTCAALNDEGVSCIFTRGRCACTAVHEQEGETTGLYQAGDDNNVVVQGSELKRSYDYCVDGERMIWWENSGTIRTGGMVMRRKQVQGRALRTGEGGFVTIPREEILRATQGTAEAQGDSGE